MTFTTEDIVDRLRAHDEYNDFASPAFCGKVADEIERLHDTQRIQADTQRIQAELISAKDSEIEVLRAAANRTLNAFFCCEGLNNTHLMDAFSEWAVLMNPEAFPEAVAWVAKFKASHD